MSDKLVEAVRAELGPMVSPAKARALAVAVREADREVTLDMTNAGWAALKAAFARFGVDVMALPFDHSAGFVNSDVPLEIYRAMMAATQP